ncbi:hypothetical protein HKBW3S44_01566 [Candidatus Hakubella thermalkaliphila]|uniref:Integrase catalytic domain-containing protein n=2 Tax=Candidatus Hakubella thermalkaliphila TaxID=2754717 RepID=A0A6V8Q4M7_9ACTN|nr:hypothetical protein HKBW3S09_00565 [Candidatus Hakubella thermalkaliphila]GFP31266.1 hypothetical protein HKBW3S34_02185 [Candidatus Hakubella thermalkaliphila]GFP37886.1 hypothetical protein HKBW3S44_01566 [Candidatus Hakubella thermalkaliphila]GFP39732.1 hypothetical protein HKBW3S47_01430 [Candidatus Hakubella thermalkaliphila]GFP43798.1 hypothetical protein HKBW3C_02928 [Candidatus Hakubella thermalkaliphila]
MSLTMKEKKALTRETRDRYRKASKKQRGEILERFTWLTKYNRSYAARILRQKRVLGEEKKKVKRKRKKKYGEEVLLPLRKIWAICDGICGKRLAPFLPEIIPILESFGELKITEEVREKLLSLSAATIDRLLAPLRKQYQLKGRCTTKPGSLLKNQIPIRTFADWEERRPGFVEADLVSHDGGEPRGDFIQSLDVVDVCSSWTETRAVKNKARKWVLEALKDIKAKLPFKLLGLNCDNGGEFINAHLLAFCEENQITFTRSRPYRKNDSCFVEQKNYSVVRRAVGYQRYDTEEELETLNELYRILRLYTNFFQPVRKLKEKIRIGSKVKKSYDQAQTPYQRVLASPFVSSPAKEKLKEEYAKLNPAELKREITRLQDKLLKLAHLKAELRRKREDETTKDFEDIFDESTRDSWDYVLT